MTLDDGAIAAHVAAIDDRGFTVLEGAVEPALVAALRDALRRLERELDVQPRRTAAEGHSTLRMYNLLAKDPIFQAMPVHPSVLPIVEVAATFSDRLLELLGYRLYKGAMGHVDGRSPGEVVFGPRFAETAYRDAERRRAERRR